MHLRLLRIQCQPLPIGLLRGIRVPSPLKHPAEVGIGLRKIRLQVQCLTQTIFCSGDMPVCKQGVAFVEEILGGASGRIHRSGVKIRLEYIFMANVKLLSAFSRLLFFTTASVYYRRPC